MPKRRLKQVDVGKIGRKMQIILDREINRLYDYSFKHKLTDADHERLLNYLKFMPQLKKSENDDIESMSTEDIEKLLNKPTKGKS